MAKQLSLGIIGLGKMGSHLALQAVEKGMYVVGHSKHGGFDLDLEAIFENWSHGSVIRGWLVELMAKGLNEKKFDTIPPYVEDTGEVNWLVQVAVDKEISVPFIALAVMELFESRGSGRDSARAVALLRHEYGGHPFGKDEHVAEERKTGRLTRL